MVTYLSRRKSRAMSFLLGGRADLIYDINVLLQAAILIIILFALQRKMKRKFVFHGNLMMSALVLHLLLVFIVMIPSWLRYAGAVFSQPVLGAVTIIHSILGTAAAVLGIAIIVAWKSAPAAKMGCMKRKRLMLPTVLLWVSSLVLGMVFYIVAYFL